MWIPTEVSHVAGSYNFTTMSGYGGPRLQETDTTQNFPFGTTVRAYEPVQGAGEFIYLQGVASTVVGDLVNYNAFTGVTTRNIGTAITALPLAFAMAPTVANLFGWYQISGVAVAANNGTAAAGKAYQVSAAVQITSTATAGMQISGGCQILVANSTTFTKACTTRNGSTELLVPNMDALFVGLPVSGTGIPGATTIAAGVNNGPSGRSTSAGSSGSVILNNAATADGTVTVTFTRTNYSLVGGQRYWAQGAIT